MLPAYIASFAIVVTLSQLCFSQNTSFEKTDATVSCAGRDTLLAQVTELYSAGSTMHSSKRQNKGYLFGGIPYTRIGRGPRPLVVLWGLTLSEHKPIHHLFVDIYKFLDREYTIYALIPKKGLPENYSLRDIANDFAIAIQNEFCEPVDVIGLSTGGAIALHLVADHPELIKKLVIHSSAYRCSEEGKSVELRVAHFASQEKWISANAAMVSFVMPQKGIGKIASMPIVGIVALVAGVFSAPKSPTDVVTVINADVLFNFRDNLADVVVPTLLVAGSADPFYTEELFRQTAAGIPHCTLAIYSGKGHTVMGKNFRLDVKSFLLNKKSDKTSKK